MPKASLSAKDAIEVSFGLQEGDVEIIDAKVKVVQFNPSKKTGEQYPPFPAIVLTFQPLAEDGSKNGDPIEEPFSIGKLEKFHPGTAEGPDDEEPDDAGAEVECEGNCIYVNESGAELNKRAKWVIMANSMEECGFKPDVLGTGFVPSLIGTRGHVKTLTLPRGTGYTGANDPTALVFDKITQFPYEKKKAAPAKGKSAPAAAPVAKKAGKAVPVEQDDSEAKAMEILTELGAENAGATMEKKSLYSKFYARMLRLKIPMSKQQPIMACVKNDEWLADKIEDLPIAEITEDEVTFE